MRIDTLKLRAWEEAKATSEKAKFWNFQKPSRGRQKTAIKETSQGKSGC